MRTFHTDFAGERRQGRAGFVSLLLICAIPAARVGAGADDFAAALPSDVRPVWDENKAQHETTLTRERICLNGLWRWQPGVTRAEQAPTGGWGYFKVPGCWPGITDYMQKDCQTVYIHPGWKDQRLSGITAGWYEREFTVPAQWAGRRVVIGVEYLNSYAGVYVDGAKAGEIRFPGGELDITGACRTGATHRLSMLVVAMPLKGVLLSYTDSASARELKGSVSRRGLCGDVYLQGRRSGPRILDVRVETSVRKQELTIEAGLAELGPETSIRLRARVLRDGQLVKDFTSLAIPASGLKEGRTRVTGKWLPDKLWDVHTPQNMYELELSLLDASGQVLDTSWRVQFGFREFWTEGRDFFLNGTRIFLSAVPFDNAQISAGLATYAAARESLERLRGFGINYVYTHNYSCVPGAHLSFAEILRAADDTGMLLGFTLPHFSHYDWDGAEANQRYRRDAEFYVRAAQNHPSVVMYAMSHNATGYDEDMNPDMIDGIQAPRDRWARNNVGLALRAEAIATELDPSRIVYHHASGNLGPMHAINFYPNFVPPQELSDWFERWATAGVKPVFMCEYGAPFSWDWTMYRGWYQGVREFGSAAVPWQFCVAEWNAQFFGDPAYRISEPEKANLRWEAKQLREGKRWHRWDYPYDVGSTRLEERDPIFAAYLTDNWRAFRTWGVSGISPWEYDQFWRLRDTVDKRRQELKVDWEGLQRPGFSPDFVEQRYEKLETGFERSDWIATAAAQALLRNNRPLLAYLAGKPGAFTGKDHNYFPGETVEKQLIVINNCRETLSCEAGWSFEASREASGSKTVTVPTGQQERIGLRFELPAALAPGRYKIESDFKFSNGETQQDSFTVDVLARPATGSPGLKISWFDPKGETSALLKRLGIGGRADPAESDLSTCDILIVGKSALSPSGPAPDISRVKDGLKVVMFEQSAEVLERRFGFRVTEYGLRQVFERVPDHPILRGLGTENLRDWRGAATILPARLKYETRSRYGPTVQWCDIPVPRLWRCGNRGNVASVLVEKPARGDFLPIVDGGYSLQYSPLLEYREGKGMVLFCQLDVTGRTESDPAAETLVRNLVRYVAAWKAAPRRTAVYAGEPAGLAYLRANGAPASAYEGTKLSPDQVLVLGPGAGEKVSGRAAELANWLKHDGKVLAIGLGQSEANACFPFKLAITNAEHISTWFAPFGSESLFAGVSPADLHNRDPRDVPLVVSGAEVIGDGVLARAENAEVVFCQLAPWQFDPNKSANLKQTYRRASFALDRLLANLGVAGSPPVLERFHAPVRTIWPEKRWLEGMYLDQPEEWDDPYRHFRW